MKHTSKVMDLQNTGFESAFGMSTLPSPALVQWPWFKKVNET